MDQVVRYLYSMVNFTHTTYSLGFVVFRSEDWSCTVGRWSEGTLGCGRHLAVPGSFGSDCDEPVKRHPMNR